MSPSTPQCQADSSDEVKDEQLLLSPDQAESIETFRQDVRRCETDEEKFRLCAEARGRLLVQHTRVELLIALFERVMLAECPGYRSCKSSKGTSGRAQVDAEDEWDRFIGIAAKGSEEIKKCLPPLRAVSIHWGREKLQHYNWPARGWYFCKRLGPIANKMAWPEFIIKANRLLLRRAQMDGKFRRHRIRESPDPLDSVELENLGRWTTEGPYVKHKDPDSIALPFEELSLGDLPSGYGFDRYGLMVHSQFSYLRRASPEEDTGLSGPLDSGISEQSSSVESPADARTPSPCHSRLSTPLSSPPDSPPAAEPSHAARGPAETVLSHDRELSFDGGPPEDGQDTRIIHPRRTPQSSESEPVADQRATSTVRLRPRLDKPAYCEAPLRNAKPADRQPAPPALDLPAKRCCPPKIPPELVTILDRWDASATGKILYTFMSPDVPLEDMCPTHMKKFFEAVKSPAGAETVFQAADFDRGTSSRRRRASLPDLLDTSPLKRPRLSEQHAPASSHLPITQWSGCLTLDLIYYEAYRQQALSELATTQHRPSSWGRKTDELVFQILHRIRPPTDGEAYFLGGGEAARKVELGSLDAPIFTQGQQRFQWPGKDRPIEQLFRYMEDLGLDRHVSVQVPSLSVDGESYQSKTLQEVRDKFFSPASTNDPWNLLDLQTSLPSVLPAFLEGENCQLLQRVRDAALMGSSAERMAASGQDWTTWRNVIEWGLASEGGNNTGPHTDSHGYSTWLTVQQGDIGFVWMSCPSRQEEAEWMSCPHSSTVGEWRFVVLSPGQTVFFPPGTIHLVFRIRGVQTYAQGGHILQWSDLVRWLEVVIAQIQNEDSTNEEMASSMPQLVHIVERLVKNRIKAGRVEELGGRDVVERFFALVKVTDFPPLRGTS
ncbi:hypothetical protein C8A05DRAFT_17545 [Staphylotrichum tortipilum]|uniref:JmjC domain-containing protein n=1 Tax=Staphylotrichum tortipilum TaxID=2831512 RepID=A0AAN6MFY9_9PEZI|nr:hypothetical protein C8A05DRAFT_17545 [Staphylotrichum longicolle]